MLDDPRPARVYCLSIGLSCKYYIIVWRGLAMHGIFGEAELLILWIIVYVQEIRLKPVIKAHRYMPLENFA